MLFKEGYINEHIFSKTDLNI